MDANVSVRRADEGLGVRAEVKNLNSYKFVRLAIGEYFPLPRYYRVYMRTIEWFASSLPRRKYTPYHTFPGKGDGRGTLCLIHGGLSEFEIARQIALRESGQPVENETRTYDFKTK